MIIKDLKIEKLAAKGFGLAFHKDKPIFVNYALPDDIVDVEIIYKKSNVAFAKTLKIKKESPLRKKAKCLVFTECGGCNWLNTSYENQLIFKEKITADHFRKIIDPNFETDKISPSPQEYFYRNKTFLPVRKVKNEIKIGMFKKGTHDVVTHEKCLLQPQIVNEIEKVFKKYLLASKAKIYNETKHSGNVRFLGIRYSHFYDEIQIIVVTKKKKLAFTKQLVKIMRENFPQIKSIIQNVNRERGNRILGDEDKILFGQPHIFQRINDKKFKVHYKSFFQINAAQTELLYNEVKKALPQNSKVVDAYSGIGSIGISIAEKADKIFFIEENAAASKDAEFNANLNNLDNCIFINDKVETALDSILEKEKIDAIIFDPPRKGMDSKIIEYLENAKIPRIIYVSCNPATQVRDLERLQNINYKIKKLKPFDMFPQTYHIENLVVMDYEN